MAGTLYLLPCPLADRAIDEVLPDAVIGVGRGVSYFLVENAKSARAFLKALGHPRPLRELDIVEIGHTPQTERARAWLEPVLRGRDAALVSEAGVPAVADPGANIVAAAHAIGLRVKPLVGPSSLLLALMASGLNGQSFTFQGYLPVPAAERAARLLELERRSRKGETQLFIETPYRSPAMFAAILATCAASTRLALAVDVTGTAEYISMRPVAEWRKQPAPALERRPAVFSLLA
ncbi:MAG TPA: SAM-dependent methyltransferase [Burkholderiaceae bacterium]|nr:SAM-dependent methyltransferase [Burkholderiaceae bacterium]